MPKRWLKTSKTHKFLEEKLENGEILPNDQPSDVYNKYPEFQSFNLDQFRSALNRTKVALGTHLRKKKPKGNLLIYITYSHLFIFLFYKGNPKNNDNYNGTTNDEKST